MFVRYSIVLIISRTRWDDDDFLWILIVEDRFHDTRMSDMWRVECPTENIDHIRIVPEFYEDTRKNLVPITRGEITFVRYLHSPYGVSAQAYA
jgi:hypothetical protein